MPTTTTTYSFNKPVVGADEDDWGGYLNGNWDSVDDLLDGTTPITGIDINSGTIDNVVIGGTTAAAITGTTGQFNTSLNVDGTVTADGLTVDNGDILLDSSTQAFLKLDRGSTASHYALTRYYTGGTEEWRTGTYNDASSNFYVGTPSGKYLSLTSGGDISFYEDTGTTPKFFWDASAERLGIGTTSPGSTLSITTNGAETFEVFTTSAGSFVQSYNRSTSAFEDIAYKALNQAFYTGGTPTERMRIDSSGNVGIGTTSPSTLFHIDAASDGRVARFGSGTSDTGGMYVTHNSGSTRSFELSADNILILDADRANGRGSSRVQFNVDGTERMRIDSNGNVGIGTSSPSAPLTVYNSSTPSITVGYSSTQNHKLGWDSSKLTFQADPQNLNAASGILFSVDGSEAMRIDSSGNLLVSTTGNTPATGTNTGIALKSNDTIEVGTSGAAPLLLNRTSNDGNIAVFRKDGNGRGAIGTSGNNLAIHGAGTGDDATGLMFVNSGSTQRIVPCQEGFTLNDGIINLGHSSNRFKDLYLSGGVYLGGTGSANKLDDYEEGTWTPVLSSSSGESGQSYNSQQGGYTKVGSLVYCSAWINVASIGTLGGTYALLKGLPFTVGSGNANYGGGVIQHWADFGVNSAGFTIYTEPNTTYCYIHYRSSFGTSGTYMPPAGWGSSPNLMVTITYRTSA